MKFSELPKRAGSSDYEVQNAQIGSVSLTTMDHELLDAWLHIEWDGGGCGFGGFKLGNAAEDGKPSGNLPGKGYAAEFITRCISLANPEGYGTWEGLAGKPVRVLHSSWGGGIIAVGHYLKDRWFCPSVEWKESK